MRMSSSSIVDEGATLRASIHTKKTFTQTIFRGPVVPDTREKDGHHEEDQVP